MWVHAAGDSAAACWQTTCGLKQETTLATHEGRCTPCTLPSKPQRSLPGIVELVLCCILGNFFLSTGADMAAMQSLGVCTALGSLNSASHSYGYPSSSYYPSSSQTPSSPSSSSRSAPSSSAPSPLRFQQLFPVRLHPWH